VHIRLSITTMFLEVGKSTVAEVLRRTPSRGEPGISKGKCIFIALMYFKARILSLFCLCCNNAWAQSPLPFPYNKMPDLSEDQRTRIQTIHDSLVEEMNFELKKNVDSLNYFHRRTNLPIENDSLSLPLRLGLYYRSQERKIIGISLRSEQRIKVYQLLGNEELEYSIVNFDKFKRKQEGDQLCWAACLQSILNYNGIEGTQGQIVQMVEGSFDNQTTSFEELEKKASGFHANFEDPNRRTWMLEASRMDTVLNMLLVGMVTPFPVIPGESATMVAGGSLLRFGVIGIHGTHLCIIHRMVYTLKNGICLPKTVTYYDPLQDKDVTLKWEEVPTVVTDWFSFVATNWVVYTP
jgi:hypothetical protein